MYPNSPRIIQVTLCCMRAKTSNCCYPAILSFLLSFFLSFFLSLQNHSHSTLQRKQQASFVSAFSQNHGEFTFVDHNHRHFSPEPRIGLAPQRLSRCKQKIFAAAVLKLTSRVEVRGETNRTDQVAPAESVTHWSFGDRLANSD